MILPSKALQLAIDSAVQAFCLLQFLPEMIFMHAQSTLNTIFPSHPPRSIRRKLV